MLYTAWLDMYMFVPPIPVCSRHVAQLFADLAWHIEVHFANWQIEITACNVIPVNKDKRAGSPFM